MTERRNRLLVALWLCGLGAAGGAIALTLTSNHEPDPVFTAVFAPLLGIAFIGSGLVAWARRPDNRFGGLMVLVGFTWFLGALAESNDSGIFTVGCLLSSLALAAFAHAVLAFPGGRLESRLARAVVVTAYLDVTVGSLLAMLFEAKPHDVDHAPANALLVYDNHALADALGLVVQLVGFVLAVAVFAILVARWLRASAALRRVLGLVVVSSSVTLLALAVELAVEPVSMRTARIVDWVVLAGFTSVPFAFLAGLLRTHLARAAVGRLVLELGDTREPALLRDALRRALRDPTLELAFWLPGPRSFVDVAGRHVALPPDDGPRVATLVEREQRRVGAIVHDRTVCDDPLLLESVTAAAALALENARLQAELHARLDELERERDFSNAVVRTTPSLVVVFEPDGTIVAFNEACERLTGYSFAEVRGRRFWDLFVDPAEASGIRRALAEVQPGTLSRNENHWITRDGERRLIVWSNAALGDDEGKVAHVVSGGIDVTDYRRQQEELKASRVRIVEAGLAERRRLERNLHDGAQQRLVALSLALRLARARVHSSPDDAELLLDAASDELAQALEELRELARGIHPAVLTDRGLDAALEALAARVPLPVEVDAELPERLPPAVEAAAYYVAAEGLTNVVKYARATEARISVSRSNGSAVVEVADDGVGGADPTGGSGLAGLRDRIEALDGRLEIASAPGGGTQLRAEIPCGS